MFVHAFTSLCRDGALPEGRVGRLWRMAAAPEADDGGF